METAKSYKKEKNSFLNMVASSNVSTRPYAYEERKNHNYVHHQTYRSRSKKNSSSRGGTNRSSSRTHTNRSSQDKSSDKYLQKTKSSSSIKQNKGSYYNSASLKFNSILKEMENHEKSRQREHMGSHTTKSNAHFEYPRAKYDQNYDPSKKSARDEIYMMNTNTNHHHHYMYNTNGSKYSSRQKNKDSLRTNNLTNTSSNSNLNNSIKGSRSPIMGITSTTGSSKPSKKTKEKTKPSSSRENKVQNPAIPFPQSQKHYSSKLTSNMIYDKHSKGDDNDGFRSERDHKHYSYLDQFNKR